MIMRSLFLACAALMVLAPSASAACYADYKAKQENPYRLHYGVIQIDNSPCTMSDMVESTVAKRLGAAGWQLLQVRSVFEDDGLAKRKKDAGEFFLRF